MRTGSTARGRGPRSHVLEDRTWERGGGRSPQLGCAIPGSRLTWTVTAASGEPVSPGSLPVLGFLERLKTEK